MDGTSELENMEEATKSAFVLSDSSRGLGMAGVGNR